MEKDADELHRHWRFQRELPWPAVRGEKLLRLFTSDIRACPYDMELCVPTAGHLALVLVRRREGGGGGGRNAPSVTRQMSTPVAPSASQLLVPRVVYVVDAMPPRRAVQSPLRNKGNTSSISNTSTTSSSSSCILPSPTTSSHTNGISSSRQMQENRSFSINPLQQDVDELELIDELFQSMGKTGKDGSLLAKAPLLCARFDCKIIAIKFTRSNTKNKRNNSVSSSSSSAPLRCIIAREDGMAYLWEWGADLHQWTFLNRFCFLENPNLKWTRPVVSFTATEMPWKDETTELAWWSTESKQEPKLSLRKIQFQQDKNTFRTEIVVGNAFSVKCNRVIDLYGSKLGLWILTATQGVHFRSAASLSTLSRSWQRVLQSAESIEPTKDLLSTVHNVTGELLLLEKERGAVWMVTPKAEEGTGSGLTSKRLIELAMWSADEAESVDAIAGHRHALLAVTSEQLLVFSLVTGERLEVLALPSTGASVSRSIDIWTMTGAASAVGLWNSKGFWVVQAPHAKEIGAHHNVIQQNPRAALTVVKDYGSSLKFDAAFFALETLAKTVNAVEMPPRDAWELVMRSVSSPSLLLATFSDRTTPATLLGDLAQLISALHRAVHAILATGRLSVSSLDKKQSTELRRLTPANIEALHHLSNWVLLAKRKLARLQSSTYFKGRHQLRSRAMSELTTVGGGDTGSTAAASSSFSPLKDIADASNFRLSRKLRPMSSLRFAAAVTSLHHGKQWLQLLETFLLGDVSLREQHKSDDATMAAGGTVNDDDEERYSRSVPNHLLFHEERALADYRTSNSLFSKHMYLESMSRLYFHHEPSLLLPFVRCVVQYCPRSFSLTGRRIITRSHAERALSLFPPIELFVQKIKDEQAKQVSMTNNKKLKVQQQKKKHQVEMSVASSSESLLVYVDLLCYCGYYREACRTMLQCDMYDECKDKLLLNPPWTKAIGMEEDEETGEEYDEEYLRIQKRQTDAVTGAVYIALLEYCIKYRDADELASLIRLKPTHVDALNVVRALRVLLARKSETHGERADATVTVGKLRPVLLSLLQQRQGTFTTVK